MNALTDLLGSPLAQRIGWALVHFLWQGAAVALVLALVLQLLHRRSPQARYVAACCALALLAALPVMTAVVTTPVAATSPALAEARALPVRSPSFSLPDAAVSGPEGTSLPTAAGPARIDHTDIAAAKPPAPAPVAKAAWPDKLRAWVLPMLPWGLLAWLVGVVGLSLWHMSGWLMLQRIRRLARPSAQAALVEAFGRLVQRLAVSRPVRVLESTLVKVPVVIGWLRPVVLLPVGVLCGLSPAQVEAILAHELAHIRRWDCLVRMIQAVIETLLFYHPAVWWVSGRIRQESEHCCDELAVGICGDRYGYAQALAAVAGVGGPAARLTTAASGGKLLPRLRRILGLTDGQSRTSTRHLAGLSIAVSLLVAALVVSCAVDQRARPGGTAATQPATQPGGRANWGEAVQDLQVAISLDGKVFDADKPIPVRWSIRNAGTADRAILWHDLHYSPVLFDITDAGGKLYPNCGDFLLRITLSLPVPPGTIIVRPGEVKEATLDLSRFVGTLAGDLKIVGVYAPKASPTMLKEALEAPKFVNAMLDRVVSAPVRITVYRRSVGARVEMNKDIAAPAEVWHEPMPPARPEPWKVAAAETLRFEDHQGLLVAKLKIGYASWPKDVYLAKLELGDNDGKVLALDAVSFESDGIILGQPFWHPKTLQFDLGPLAKLPDGTWFRLLLTSVAPGALAPRPAGFSLGPVLERTLDHPYPFPPTPDKTLGERTFLDLDTGKYIPLPLSLAGEITDEAKIRQAGVDLYFQRVQGGEGGLMPVGLVMQEVPRDTWDGDGAIIAEAIKQARPQEPPVNDEKTWAFRTTNGRMGLIRVTDWELKPGRIGPLSATVSFRLLEESSSTRPATSPAMPMPRPAAAPAPSTPSTSSGQASSGQAQTATQPAVETEREKAGKIAALKDRSRTLRDEQKYSEAIEVLDRILELDPTDQWATEWHYQLTRFRDLMIDPELRKPREWNEGLPRATRLAATTHPTVPLVVVQAEMVKLPAGDDAGLRDWLSEQVGKKIAKDESGAWALPAKAAPLWLTKAKAVASATVVVSPKLMIGSGSNGFFSVSREGETLTRDVMLLAGVQTTVGVAIKEQGFALWGNLRVLKPGALRKHETSTRDTPSEPSHWAAAGVLTSAEFKAEVAAGDALLVRLPAKDDTLSSVPGITVPEKLKASAENCLYVLFQPSWDGRTRTDAKTTTAPAGPASQPATQPAGETVTRVYDIRDLLVIRPIFDRPGVTPPPWTVPDDKRLSPWPTEEDAKAVEARRQELTAELVALVESRVSPGTWLPKGNVGAIRVLNRQMIVTQTPAAHKDVLALVSQLRESRTPQVHMEATFLQLPPKSAVELRQWVGKELKPPPAGTEGETVLTAAQAEALLNQARTYGGHKVLAAPKVTTFNGQKAYVLVAKTRNWQLAEAGKDTKALMAFREGQVLDFCLTVSADRKHVALALKPMLTWLLAEGAQPVYAQATRNFTVSVPDGQAALLPLPVERRKALAVKSERGPDGTETRQVLTVPVDEPAGTDQVFLLVRPRIIVQREYQEEIFPPGDDAPASPATQPAADAAEIERLIKQLGGEEFAELGAAQQALEKIGLPALKALEKAARDSDPERAGRARAALKETVIGRVLTEPGGKAVAGAKVTLWHGRDGDLRTTSTDEDGRYVFTHVAANEYIHGVNVALPPGQWCQGQTVSFHLTGQYILASDLYVKTPQTISGTVRDAATRQPAAGARISIKTKEESWVASDAQGRYTLFVLPGLVQVGCFGTEDRYYPPEKESKGSFAIQAGRNAEAPDFTVASAKEFSGVVTGPDGKPVKGVDVVVLIDWLGETNLAGYSSLPPASFRALRLTTDVEGRFAGHFRRHMEIGKKEPVSYQQVKLQIAATTPDQTLGAGKEITAEGDEPDLTPIRITLGASASVSVRLADPAGKGIAGAKWIAGRLQYKAPIGGMRPDDGVKVSYLGDGRYLLEQLIPGTLYHFMLEAPGHTLRPVYLHNKSDNYRFEPGERKDMGTMQLKPLAGTTLPTSMVATLAAGRGTKHRSILG